MYLDVGLISKPSQEFTFKRGNKRWKLRVKSARNIMVADIYLNNNIVVLGRRVTANTPIISYQHLAKYGDFAVITENDEIPNYEKFGITQFLIYQDRAEMI